MVFFMNDEKETSESPRVRNWFDFAVEVGSSAALLATVFSVLKGANSLREYSAGFFVVELFVLLGGIIVFLRVLEGALADLTLSGKIVRALLRSPLAPSVLTTILTKFIGKRD